MQALPYRASQGLVQIKSTSLCDTHRRPSAAHTPLSAAPHPHPSSTLTTQLCSLSGRAAQVSADARTSTHATLQVRLHRVGQPAPTPVSPSPLVQVRGQRKQQWHHVTALRSRPQPRAAVAAWPSSASCCRSTPAPAQLLLGGGASRWRPGLWSRSAASPLRSPHARLTLAGFLLSFSQTPQRSRTPTSGEQEKSSPLVKHNCAYPPVARYATCPAVVPPRMSLSIPRRAYL
jgi:hypothetical protein